MKAVDEPLGQLLNRERRHLIPTYQRDYEWTERGQWELFADDILAVADKLVERRQWASTHGEVPLRAEASVAPHFLGAVVFEALPQSGADIASCAVIDGQQRLTTIHLFLRALVDVLSEEDDLRPRAKQVRKLIMILDEDVEPEDRYKLWPRRRDRSAWRAVMADESPEDEHRYTAARRYFGDRITAAVEDLDDAARRAQLEALVDTVVQKIKIVVVDLEGGDDAQLIFEVLNGRQTRLSASDLVKNLLFMRADNRESELDQLYERYWSPFDEQWWSGSVGRGHAARGRRDQLLATWLTVQTAEEVNLGHLYGEAREYLTDTRRPLPELLESIHTLAREYRQIYERPSDVGAAIASVYHRMERLGVTTMIPLLAWLRTLPPQRLSQAQHERAVLALDSFVMRRLITGGQTRGYGRAFLIVLQEAKGATPEDEVPAVIERALLESPYGVEWPDDASVETEMLHRTFYGRISQERIRMLLGSIDAHLQRSRPFGEAAVFDYDALTIEHVMPRAWQRTWPVAGDSPAEKAVAAQERDRHVHRLGNLTLVTKPLNPSMSNGTWPRKKQALDQHSKLCLNEDIVAEQTWDESIIDSRARALAATACAVWPRVRVT